MLVQAERSYSITAPSIKKPLLDVFHQNVAKEQFLDGAATILITLVS